MTALSINLPSGLAEASQQIARKLGISRMQFIRVAIAHELQRVEKQLAQEEMAKAFDAMRTHSEYLREIEELDAGFSTKLPEEKNEWWKK